MSILDTNPIKRLPVNVLVFEALEWDMLLDIFVNYCVVGLLWTGFLRVRYGPARHSMSMANWIKSFVFWPLLMLVYAQGCIFGARQK